MCEKKRVIIGHASIDERGEAQGGNAGDQTGKEVCTRGWYDNSWTCVIRPKKTVLRLKKSQKPWSRPVRTII